VISQAGVDGLTDQADQKKANAHITREHDGLVARHGQGCHRLFARYFMVDALNRDSYLLQ
jgi:hypothetical protein